MSVSTLTESRTFGRRLEFTLEQILPGIKNNTFVHSPVASLFLSMMFDDMFGAGFMRGSGMEEQSGGESVRVQHNLGKNTTAKRLAGPFDTTDTTPSDTVRHSRANWTDYSSTVTISLRERLENVGDRQIAGMVEFETRNAMLSLVDLVADDFYSLDGAAPANSITPLDSLINANNTVQGLAGGTYSDWNSRGLDPRGTAPANVDFDGSTAGTQNSFAVAGVQNMRSAWHNSTEGALQPNAILTTYDILSFYEQEITPQERFTSINTGNLSFLNLAFKSAPVVADPKCAAQHMFFINTQALRAAVLAGANFSVGEAHRAEAQEAWNTQISWKGQVVVIDRRLVNKIEDITA